MKKTKSVPKGIKQNSEKTKRDKALAHGNSKESSADALETACFTMKTAGLKRTPNRENLLRFLIENHGPFSKDEIKSALPKDDFDSVTLYRNLAHFEEIGLVRRSEFGDGVSRYEFQAHPDEHHHHIVCTDCRRVDSLDDCILSKLDAVVEKLGYTKVRHSLEFFGLCEDCAK